MIHSHEQRDQLNEMKFNEGRICLVTYCRENKVKLDESVSVCICMCECVEVCVVVS